MKKLAMFCLFILSGLSLFMVSSIQMQAETPKEAAMKARAEVKESLREAKSQAEMQIREIQTLRDNLEKVADSLPENSDLRRELKGLINDEDRVIRAIKDAKSTYNVCLSRLTDAPIIGNIQNYKELFSTINSEMERARKAAEKQNDALKDHNIVIEKIQKIQKQFKD